MGFSFSSHKSPANQVLVFPFYKWAKLSSEFNNLLKGTEPIRDKAGIQT